LTVGQRALSVSRLRRRLTLTDSSLMTDSSTHPTPYAGRMTGIAPFHVMSLLARAQALEAAGRSIVHMEVGEPDFPTPEPIVAAGIQALREGQTRYTPAAGLPALRAAVARHYRDAYGVDLPADRVLITPGASGALQLAVAVLVDPGREVLMADPGYPCNRHFVRMLDGRAVAIPVGAETAYQLTPALVERHWSERTSAVIIASPSNPTGTLLPANHLRAIIDIVAERGGRVIMDEIYQGLVYDRPSTTALALSCEVFVVNSFSKYYGMTGWRLGWLVAPEPYLDDIERLAQNIFLAPSTLAQHAALVAFRPETQAILLERRDILRERRDFLLPALRELGFGIPVQPQGAFYLYADCSRFSTDSRAFADRVLEVAGVAITPGVDFGDHRADSHVRFAYTAEVPRLAEGVARLGRYLDGLREAGGGAR
jgi:aspartate/methionine/tyrosine aminotransferase